MNKAIFIDLDQTLTKLHTKTKVSLLDINAIKKAQREGWYVVMATGRSTSDAVKIWEQIKYNDYGNFAICSTGMNIENFKTGELIQRKFLDKELAQKYIAYAIDRKAWIKVSNQKALFVPKKTFVTLILNKLFHVPIYNYSELNVNFNDLSKIGVTPSISGRLSVKYFNDAVKDFPNLQFVKAGSKRYIECTTEGINKGQAAIKLAKELNIDLSKSVAIGDSQNDLSIFKVVGHPVAVRNANKIIKKNAKYITKSVYKSGVSEFINYHLKNVK